METTADIHNAYELDLCTFIKEAKLSWLGKFENKIKNDFCSYSGVPMGSFGQISPNQKIRFSWILKQNEPLSTPLASHYWNMVRYIMFVPETFIHRVLAKNMWRKKFQISVLEHSWNKKRSRIYCVVRYTNVHIYLFCTARNIWNTVYVMVPWSI